MTIQQTKGYILIWVESCLTVEQVEMLVPVIISHIVVPFKDKVSGLELDEVRESLVEALTKKKLELIKPEAISEVPTFQRNHSIPD